MDTKASLPRWRFVLGYQMQLGQCPGKSQAQVGYPSSNAEAIQYRMTALQK